jgi:WD40-like Beta Propeller Repeat
MNEHRPSIEFEEQLRQACAAPDPDPAFAGRLRAQLASTGPGPRSRATPFALRWAWAFGLGAILLMAAAVLAVGPQNVAAGVQHLLGYIPGVGVVQVDDSLRALAQPVSATRDGVTLTVKQAVLSADKTVVDFVVDGVAASAYPKSENVPGCSGGASLRLPDGTVLAMTGGGGPGWAAGYEARLTYPAIDAGVKQATFVLACINDTLPGRAPENWELALSFVPAPPDLTLLPIVEVSPLPPTSGATAVAPVVDGSPSAQAPGATAAPTVAPAPYGLGLVLDRYIALADGYYLIGHTTWSDTRLTSASLGDWLMKLIDAHGQEIPIEPANFQDIGIDQPQPNAWAYRVYGLAFNGPLTLRNRLAQVEFKTPVAFALDLRPNGFDFSSARLGTSWPISPIALEVLGLPVSVTQATYTKQGDLTGFKLSIQAGPELQMLPLSIDGGVTNGNSGGGGSNRDERSGQVESYVLTNGQISFPLSLSARSAAIAGRWETTWNPPVVAGQTPAVPDAPACLTLAGWKQAVAHPAALPAGLGGKVIVYGRIKTDGLPPSPDNYGIFVAGLDGSRQQVSGPGTWPAFSPDGTRAAYSGPDGLHVADLASGRDSALPGTTTNDYNPRWSLDGGQIAFIRGDEHALYVIGADGQGLRRLADSAEYLLGWAPGDEQLYYSTSGVSGQQVKSIDLASGVVQVGMMLGSKDVPAALSPDGQWLAFVAHVRGKLAGGLYLAHLDGSERRLIAQLDYWGIGNPVWSPDGQWLTASVLDADQFAPTTVPALINLQSCQAIPLAGIEGDVQGWVR